MLVLFSYLIHLHESELKSFVYGSFICLVDKDVLVVRDGHASRVMDCTLFGCQVIGGCRRENGCDCKAGINIERWK
jgi:hypothetical protein